MWSGVNFDATQIAAEAISFLNNFWELIYLIGGITVGAFVLVAILSALKKGV